MKIVLFVIFGALLLIFLPKSSKSSLFLLQQLSYSGTRYIRYLLFCIKSKRGKTSNKRQSLDLTKRIKRTIIFEETVACLVYVLIYFLVREKSIPIILISALLSCVAIILSSPVFVLFGNLFSLPIEHIISRYYEVAASKKLKDAKVVIGITGSFGKTSVKNILAEMLKKNYSVFATPKSYNTISGISKCVNLSYDGEDIAIIEMGARRKNDIKRICRSVKPDIAVITSIGICHLSYFKSVENIEKTKYEITADKKVKKVFFGKTAKRLYDICEKEKYYYNESFFIENISCKANGTTFVIGKNDEKAILSTKLLGEHIADNILLCAEIADKLNVSFCDIAKSIESLKPIPHRLELIKSERFVIIDDSYNSNPESARAAINAIKFFSGKKYVITSGFAELGKRENEENFILGKELSKCFDKVLLVGDECIKPIIEGLYFEGFLKENMILAKSVFEATQKFTEIANEGDVLLYLNDLPDIYLR